MEAFSSVTEPSASIGMAEVASNTDVEMITSEGLRAYAAGDLPFWKASTSISQWSGRGRGIRIVERGVYT